MINWPSARDWIFSIKAFVAAMLALYIALYLALPRPYWAMATVYIVSHPLTGATRSKAVYRVLGTLLGAAASVVMVPNLVNAPFVLTAAVSLWTGTLLYIALLHRSPRSYVFLLAAYTLPLVALPAVNSSEAIFELAVSRAEEIILGILCASVVGAIVFPDRVADVLHDKSAAWLADAALWATDMLSPDAGETVRRHASRHRLTADILALDQLVSHLSYDTDSAVRVRDARELRGRMTMLLPVLSSLTAVVTALRKHPGGVPPALSEDMAAVSAWISGGGEERMPTLSLGEAAWQRQTGEPDWHAALVATAEERLRTLLGLWQDCVSLQRRIGTAVPAREWTPAFGRWSLGQARHFDHGMLLFSTSTIALAIFCMGAIWIQSGWADGGVAVGLGAVACCFFAAMDEPAPMIRSFFAWNVVALVIATVYLFAILPNAHDFGMLVAMFAVPYLIIGLMLAQPRLSLIALLLAVITASDIGIQGAYNADFHSFFNHNIGGIAGILFALLWTLLTRPFGARVAVRRLLRACWGDIAGYAQGRDPREHATLRARTLDRLGQLVPRLAASEDEMSTDGFAEVRVELSTLALQNDLASLTQNNRRAIQDVLGGIAAFYRQRLDTTVDVPSGHLEQTIRMAARGLAAQADSVSRNACAALVELHVALFATSPSNG
ncbi:Tetrapartite efflux system, inner membrane component FusBC-like (plasmid) [Cupriavidus necator H850]|uniref:FUSC family protein n=1 Tax=Cupriavidus necator TaxID=106590 RepID=UPI00129DCC0E|nr:FUSC family protein [Cupriavidus necator]KAI3605928.1 Tetrapartite efflux system, inner membrane component FusBC-like [Cupriavidus necator H850]